MTKTEVELDFDDGKYLYDVEFTCGQTEYEYKINATDGSVYLSEINGVTVKEPSVSGKTFIGTEAAKEKSLTAANVTAEKATFTKVKIDSDHGVYVYEIKFTADGTKYEGDAVILATGHSARDIYELFHRRGWLLEAKPFALGVRVEHPQALINEIQYHGKGYSPLLPAAAYSLTTQACGHGVFSFCMCPGGVRPAGFLWAASRPTSTGRPAANTYSPEATPSAARL